MFDFEGYMSKEGKSITPIVEEQKQIGQIKFKDGLDYKSLYLNFPWVIQSKINNIELGINKNNEPILYKGVIKNVEWEYGEIKGGLIVESNIKKSTIEDARIVDCYIQKCKIKFTDINGGEFENSKIKNSVCHDVTFFNGSIEEDTTTIADSCYIDDYYEVNFY